MRTATRLFPLTAALAGLWLGAPLHAQPRFTNVAPALEIDHEGTGRGTVVFDFDGDGKVDIFQANSDGANVLYQQVAGGFADVTAEAGVAGTDFHWGVTAGDYDNDGDPDLYVAVGGFPGEGPNLLFRNDGGSFTEVAAEAGVDGGAGRSTAPVWIDYDRDGWLDLFVANYNGPAGPPDVESTPPCVAPAVEGDFALASNKLFHNNGDGTFADVTAGSGLELTGPSFGVTVGDYDGDRWPDIYVAAYDGPNSLYRNRGDSTFRDVTADAGNLFEPRAAMSPSFEDFDNDGRLDLFVSAWNYLNQDGTYRPDEGNRFYRNLGDGTFQEIASTVGVDHHGGHMGMQTADLDFDGWMDIYLGSGGPNTWQDEPDLFFRNLGASGQDGFADVTQAVGIRNRNMAHGVSFADFDGDGDLDFYVGNGGPAYLGAGQPNFLYLNRGPVGNGLFLELEGTVSNRAGLGASVIANVGGQIQRRDLSSGSGFGSQKGLAVPLGFGGVSTVDLLTVSWPSGVQQSLTDVAASGRLTLTEPDTGVEVTAIRSPKGHVRLQAELAHFGAGLARHDLELTVRRPGGGEVARLIAGRHVDLLPSERRWVESTWRPGPEQAPGGYLGVARLTDRRTGRAVNLGAVRFTLDD